MAAKQTIKPAGYRLVKTCSLLFWPSTDMPCKRRQSHFCKYGTPFFKHSPLICIEKKGPEAGLGAFVAKQENLRGTGRLHALVHIFVPRSDAQAELADSISRYGRPFMQTDWLFCVLH